VLDLQVVKSRQVLTPTAVAMVRNTEVPTLEIRGSNLHTVTEVRINDRKSPAFEVTSSRRILAQLPPGIPFTTVRLADGTIGHSSFAIRTVELLTGLPVSNAPAKLFFELGRTPVTIQGIQKLVQQVTRVLLTSPGHDLFDPDLGGGFLSQVGRSISSSRTGAIMTDLAIGISRTQTQIIDSQTIDPAIPPSERLVSLSVIDALVDQKAAAIFVVLRVVSAAGESAIADLTI
jgi:hypothetical protein